jgi:hypothetical protein
VPTVVEARDEDGAATRALSDRFQALVDSLAMQLGLAESAEYLDAWVRSAPAQLAGSAAEVAEAVAAELEGRFSEFAAGAFRR